MTQTLSLNLKDEDQQKLQRGPVTEERNSEDWLRGDNHFTRSTPTLAAQQNSHTHH